MEKRILIDVRVFIENNLIEFPASIQFIFFQEFVYDRQWDVEEIEISSSAIALSLGEREEELSVYMSSRNPEIGAMLIDDKSSLRQNISSNKQYILVGFLSDRDIH